MLVVAEHVYFTRLFFCTLPLHHHANTVAEMSLVVRTRLQLVFAKFNFENKPGLRPYICTFVCALELSANKTCLVGVDIILDCKYRRFMDNAHVFRSTQSYCSCVLATPQPVSRKNSMKRGFAVSCAATIPSSTITRTKGQTITRASSQRQQATVQIDTTRLLGISRSNSWHSAVTSRDAPIHGAYFPSTAHPKTCLVHDTMHTPRRSLYHRSREIQQDETHRAAGTIIVQTVDASATTARVPVQHDKSTWQDFRRRFWLFLFRKI